MSVLREQYNEVLKREKSAEKFFDTATGDQVDKWLPEYNRIVRNLGQLIIDIEKEEGRELSTDEVLNGF